MLSALTQWASGGTRSFDSDSGLFHVRKRGGGITGLYVDGAGGIGDDMGIKSHAPGIESAFFNAVVQGQSGNPNALNGGLAHLLGKIDVPESGVAVAFRRRRFADDGYVLGQLQVGMELGAP